MRAIDAELIETIFGTRSASGKDPLANLNDEQRAAASHVEGPLLIRAGAGTGKTTVMVRRIANLVSQQFAEPEEILALTFTKKAAREMKERLEQQLGRETGKRVVTSNFHSFCADLLRRHGSAIRIPEDFSILDDSDLLTMLARVAQSHAICSPQDTTTLRAILTRISAYKEEGLSLDMVPSTDHAGLSAQLRADPPVSQDVLLRAWRELDALKRAASSLDFGDLIVQATRLLRRNPRVRAEVANYRFIMVDEYQDTSPVQDSLVRLLARGHDNVAIVGDTDQSIYEWRSARPEIMQNFPATWTNCRVITLGKNYRSTQQVLDLGNRIVEPLRRQDGLEKSLTGVSLGHAPVFRCFSSKIEEARWIAQRIAASVEAGQKPGGIAVLARTAAGLLDVKQALARAGLKTVQATDRAILEDPATKRALAGLRLSENRRDFAAFLRLASDLGASAAEIGRIEQAVVAGRDTIPEAATRLFRAARPMSAEAARWEALHLRLDAIVSTRDMGSVPEAIREIERIFRGDTEADLPAALRRVCEAAEPFARAIDFLEALALDADFRASFTEDRIVLSTIHAAKGLEFEAVYMPGLNEGVLPSARALATPHGRMEERRLAHVAITRAKSELVLTAEKGAESSYLAELGFVESAKKTVVKRAGRRLRRAF
ncbi:ATP-dependent helicase [Tranquillimonas alkanivorans]|uniref:DNA 3'-5' helicase n=1 Tax=Tranquillimonas alkanivorans TaxID=441119 RepID=A0A1I5WBY6_9RHOB|nr:ATP-dependent helicase [Tranquillimonas alkanivorans]SFQ17274.1 DNA helicase-2 / ATP-dependent DNA helicase PcrA [Tranquillimonas alkanivorans]